MTVDAVLRSRTAIHEAYSYAVGKLFGATMTGNTRSFLIFCGASMVIDLVTSVVDEANV